MMQIEDIQEDLINLISDFGVELDFNCEEFFQELLANFSGTNDEFLEIVKINLPNWFRSIGPRPEWIQSADWQFLNKKPMIFLGQINISQQENLFHDDASVFVFIDSETGVTQSVIQVS